MNSDKSMVQFNWYTLCHTDNYDGRQLYLAIWILRTWLDGQYFWPVNQIKIPYIHITNLDIVNNFMWTKRLLSVLFLSTSFMMTSSNGNIFRVTGPLCGEFTGPVEFLAQRPVTRSFDVFFDLRLNKRLSKQPWGWWFEMPSWSLWRHCNVCAH